MTRKYSTWTMLRELQRDNTLIFEAASPGGRTMRCRSNRVGSCVMCYVDGVRDGETTLIHERHDWVIVNRAKQKHRVNIGRIKHGEMQVFDVSKRVDADKEYVVYCEEARE